MLVFIDESGDPGFELTQGSTPFFVIAMVCFSDETAASQAATVITSLRTELKVPREFKFSKCSDSYRDAFFDCISGCKFQSRYLIVEKKLIHSSNLKEHKETFYNYFIRQLLEHDGGLLEEAKIIIDGSGNSVFRSELQAYLRRNLPAQNVKNIRLKASHSDPLLQLADMCAGAIGRSCREGRDNASRWRQKLSRNGQISNIWSFR